VLELLFHWIANIPSLATPYALASLGLIISELSGVLSLGAEGLMLVGALCGVGAYLALGGYPWVALVVSMAAASMVSVLFAGLVVLLRVNQVIAGLALVFFCQGLTNLVGTVAGWSNHTIAGLATIRIWPWSQVQDASGLSFMQDPIALLTIPIFTAVWLILNRSSIGLRLRSVGENPEAADAAGLNISLYRFVAVLCGSALVGLAGAYISVVDAKIWVAGITGGRGWIAVALVIFARWHPWRALWGALLFGGIEALIPQIAAAGLRLPQYFVLMTPYVATFLVMIWTGITKYASSDEPAALGQPYVREERR
jgi:general nucleoside transport system permease protein